MYTYLSTSVFFALPAEAFQPLLPVSDTYTRLSTTVVYVVGAMTPAKNTMLLLSLTDNHVIDAWVHMPPERFYPYSLLSGTTIRTTNRTLFLVFLWVPTKPYASVTLTRTSSVPEPRLYCSRTRKLRHLPQ